MVVTEVMVAMDMERERLKLNLDMDMEVMEDMMEVMVDTEAIAMVVMVMESNDQIF